MRFGVTDETYLDAVYCHSLFGVSCWSFGPSYFTGYPGPGHGSTLCPLLREPLTPCD